MRQARRQFGFAVLLACLCLAFPAPAATSSKIGYVDMKRLLDQAPQVLAARNRLEKEFAQRDDALKADEMRLQKMRDALDSERAQLAPQAIRQRQQAIDVLAGSIRRARSRLKEELKNRSDQELDRSWQTISNAVVEYAREQRYDLVVPSPVIYASPAIDITDEVLERLRRQNRGEAP